MDRWFLLNGHLNEMSRMSLEFLIIQPLGTEGIVFLRIMIGKKSKSTLIINLKRISKYSISLMCVFPEAKVMQEVFRCAIYSQKLFCNNFIMQLLS